MDKRSTVIKAIVLVTLPVGLEAGLGILPKWSKHFTTLPAFFRYDHRYSPNTKASVILPRIQSC